MAVENVAKGGEIEIRQFCQINKACTVFGPANGNGYGCKMFRTHDAQGMMIPLHDQSLLDRLCFQAGSGTQKLHGKIMNQDTFLIELIKTKFIESTENRIQTYQKGAGRRV